MNFVVDHSGTWRVRIATQTWTIIGWAYFGDQAITPIVFDHGRAVFVNEHLDSWAGWQLERGMVRG